MPALPKNLTKTLVEKTPPNPNQDVFLWDNRVPGFGVRIYPSGKRKYVFQYRTQRHQQRRMVVGVHGALTTEQARGIAADLYEIVRKGGDPAHDKKLAATRGKDTIPKMVDDFMTKFMEQKKHAESYVSGTRALFTNHVLPRWRGRDIRDITRRDVSELLDKVAENAGPIAANRTLAAIRKLFNWALQRGIIDANPASMAEKPGQETRRERVLAADELQDLWPTLDTLPYPFGSFFKMLLITGQRRDEVAGMRWADIDEKERVWTLPSELTKPGRAHAVPLSSLAWQVLEEAKSHSLPGYDGMQAATYVFTTRGDRPISGFGKAKSRLDQALAKVRAESGGKVVEAWTIHDLRRTVATGLGRLGIPRFVIARVLNHADRTVTAIYDKYEYLAEKKHALEAWAQYLLKLNMPPESNVVPILTAAG